MNREPTLAERILTFNRPCSVTGCAHVATEGTWCSCHMLMNKSCREVVGFHVDVDERCPHEVVDIDGMAVPCGHETWNNCWAVDGDLLYQTCFNHGTETGDAAASAMSALADAAALRDKVERAGIKFVDDRSDM